MAWHSDDDRDSTDVEDEAGVGLIAPTSEKRHQREQRHSPTSKLFLSIALVLSNVVWAGICLTLWRELQSDRIPARVFQERFETDFGTATSLILPSQGDSAKHLT